MTKYLPLATIKLKFFVQNLTLGQGLLAISQDVQTQFPVQLAFSKFLAI